MALRLLLRHVTVMDKNYRDAWHHSSTHLVLAFQIQVQIELFTSAAQNAFYADLLVRICLYVLHVCVYV